LESLQPETLRPPGDVHPNWKQMLTLLEHIEKRLSTHKACMVFESLLEAAFPFEKLLKEKRAEAIHAFAKANGLVATIHDPGIRVTFRRAPDPNASSRKGRRGVGSGAG
jgi:hypothetical protein